MLLSRIELSIDAYIINLILVSLTIELLRHIFLATSLEYHTLARHRGLKRKMFGMWGTRGSLVRMTTLGGLRKGSRKLSTPDIC